MDPRTPCFVNGHRRLTSKVYGDEQILLTPAAARADRLYRRRDLFSGGGEDEHLLVIGQNPLAQEKTRPLATGRAPVLNGLLHHVPSQAQPPRAGIVHRLDKDTSGPDGGGKNPTGKLTCAPAARHRQRHYRAVADGLVRQSGTIDAAIGFATRATA